MLEINPSKQRSLPNFFTQDFKFYCLLLEKNVYLLNFSFKFNEIKFYTMLMNWSIREKMLSYFYNKLSLCVACDL